MCQMLYEECQMSKILTHRYSTVSNMRRYGYQCYNFFCLFYLFFSLLPTHLSLSLSLQHSSLSLLSGLHLSIAPYFFLTFIFFYLSLSSSLLSLRLQQPSLPHSATFTQYSTVVEKVSHFDIIARDPT